MKNKSKPFKIYLTFELTPFEETNHRNLVLLANELHQDIITSLQHWQEGAIEFHSNGNVYEIINKYK